VTGLASAVASALGGLPRTQGGAQPAPSSRFRTVALAAEDQARQLGDEYTSTEHLLLALSAESGRAPAATALTRAGVTPDTILQALTAVRGSQRVTDPNPEGKYQALERYGRDLTA